VAFFIDPPYTAAGKRAGKRLYTHHALDHERLFATAARLTGPFLMTYDNDPALVALAAAHGFHTRTIPMQNTHLARMDELIISRDLNWL
jgi:DNA adenine methylase